MLSKASQPNCLLQRVSEEIEALSSYVHIQQVKKINDYAYKLQYHPSQTLSTYKEKTYNLELLFSSNYPDDPPTLRFTDQIYHLNVGFSSGEVRMAVLEDDWSPFLSLVSLIQSLDQILETPDENYALDDDMLRLFQMNRSEYFKKVLEHNLQDDALLYNTIGKETHEEGFGKILVSNLEMNHSQISNSNIENISQVMEDHEKSKTINNELHEKREIDEYKQKAKKLNLNNSKEIEKSKSKRAIKQTLDMDVAKSIEVVQHPGDSPQIIMKTRSLMRTNSVDSKMSPTLGKINQTISSFLEELNEIQGQISIARNKGIIDLLKEKYESQLEMLRELMEISENAKRKIIRKLKEEVHNL